MMLEEIDKSPAGPRELRPRSTSFAELLCLENLWHREHLEASIQGPFRLVK